MFYHLKIVLIFKRPHIDTQGFVLRQPACSSSFVIWLQGPQLLGHPVLVVGNIISLLLGVHHLVLQHVVGSLQPVNLCLAVILLDLQLPIIGLVPLRLNFPLGFLLG